MKADDDMFVNINKLIYELNCLSLKNVNNTNLANNSSTHDNKNNSKSNKLLLGSLIRGAKPIADSTNKWLVEPQYISDQQLNLCYCKKICPYWKGAKAYI